MLGLLLLASCKQQRSLPEEQRKASPVSQGVAPQHTSGLRDGDLIFHESLSSQSEMVRALTGSRWTHMGVVFHEAKRAMVFEAVSPVRMTPLREWIARGRQRRYVVKRLRDAETRLSSEAAARMRKLGATWLGRAYDLRFRWDDEALYCSELAYKLFDRGAGVQLGRLQSAAEMNFDDERVQQALRKRFANARFDPAETVVTPDSIFNDAQLIEVRSP
jgi:hypothetical protein